MASDRLRQVSNLVFAIGQAAASPITPLVGLPAVGAISDRYPTYVVPAGYAFSIWSLIFALSIAYAVWQLLPAQRENPLLRRVGWLTAAAFAGACCGSSSFPRGCTRSAWRSSSSPWSPWRRRWGGWRDGARR